MKAPLISILPRPPHPTRDGLAIRNYHLLRALAESFSVKAFTLRAPHLPAGEYPAGVDVTEVPQPRRESRRVVAAAASLALGEAYSARMYRSTALDEALAAAVRGSRPAWVVAHAYHVGPAALAASRPAWIDFHNVDSRIWARMGETGRSLASRVFARRQVPPVERFERDLLEGADGVSCVSSVDEGEMRRLAPNVRPLVVPNGVDLTRYGFRGRAPASASPEERHSSGPLVFVGDLTWPPNAEGLAWFAEGVWPLLRSSGLRVEVLGRGAPAELVRLAPEWTFLGEGGDTRPLWTRAAAAIVPLLAGGGTRLKILEAAASGAPVVSTTVGAEGLGFADGSEILLRDDPAGFADAVLRLAGDRAFAEGLAAAARARVEREFDWRAIGERLARRLAGATA
jgi:glycosyltransferase involved in cell wall biosynthesis